jgi:intracellular septation protein A
MRFVGENLAPLIVFLLLSRFWGLKVAIGATILFVAADTVRRLWLRLGFTRLYVMSAAMTTGFGGIDLFTGTPFMLSYEAVITNLVSFVAFLAGAHGKTSMIQEIVEQRRGARFVDRPDMQRFFVYLTLFWAVYFLFNALFYLWVAQNYPVDVAAQIRSVTGTAGFLVMLFVSISQGKRLHGLCDRLGLLPPRTQQPAEVVAATDLPLSGEGPIAGDTVTRETSGGG